MAPKVLFPTPFKSQKNTKNIRINSQKNKNSIKPILNLKPPSKKKLKKSKHRQIVKARAVQNLKK